MKKHIAIFALVILALGLMAFFALSHISAAGQEKSNGESSGDLSARVLKLEAQVAALETQVKDLSSKASSRVLTIPQMQNMPGSKMPPGAKEYEYGGMKYWIVPLKDGK